MAIDALAPAAVIGAGRLGASLAAALAGAGVPVLRVSSRDPAHAAALAAALGPGTRALGAAEAVTGSRAVFLALPDGAITTVAAGLPWRPGQAAIHCSGATGLEALAGAEEAGAFAGCLHPLQTFPHRTPEPERFAGIVCGVEGAEPLGSALEALVRRFGSEPVRLEGVDRAAYHASAVFASNYVVALMEAAGEAWAAAGLPPEIARRALAPLLAAAAANVAALPLDQALTGPIARGDVATVARHLAALAPEAPLAALYRALGARLLRLPLALDPGAREALAEIFRTED